MNGEILIKFVEAENKVIVSGTHKIEDNPILYMVAAEYLMNIFARFSNAGYDKAMQLLADGAKTYKQSNMPTNKTYTCQECGKNIVSGSDNIVARCHCGSYNILEK